MSQPPLDIESVLGEAERQCAKAGSRLTPKRKQVFMALLYENKPLSAYEISDHINAQYGQSIPAMSVYRMLDFLIAENLVHKLCSTGKYIVCAHINCKSGHPLAQFLICDTCGEVQEADVEQGVMQALAAGADDAGFTLNQQQLELHCVCKRCR